MPRFANYQYSLTSQQQQSIQLYLRRIPPHERGFAWELLHQLTYTNSWTDTPESEVPTVQYVDYKETSQ